MSAPSNPDALAGTASSPDDPDDAPGDAETRDSATLVGGPAARRKVAAESVHEHPTQQLPNTRGLPTTLDGDSRQTTATTPLAAMQAEEVERTRAFGKLAIAIGVGAAAGQLGHAEVEQLPRVHAVLLGQEHVVRLEIAVDDALAMGVRDRLAHQSQAR